jgi:hypothetical protein
MRKPGIRTFTTVLLAVALLGVATHAQAAERVVLGEGFTATW